MLESNIKRKEYMAVYVWECPACGFHAETQFAKKEHQRFMNDSAHQKSIGMKGGEAMHDVEASLQEAGESLSDYWKNMLDEAKLAARRIKNKL